MTGETCGSTMNARKAAASLTIALARLGGGNHWMLQVAPQKVVGPFGRLLGRANSARPSDVVALALEVHSALRKISGVSSMQGRWDGMPTDAALALNQRRSCNPRLERTVRHGWWRAAGAAARSRRAGCASTRPLRLSVRGPFVTPHQIVALALRLFAIWLGIQALSYVPWFFQVRGTRVPRLCVCDLHVGGHRCDHSSVVVLPSHNRVETPSI